VIQTDGVEFDFQFTALQERHNGSPENPFSSSSTSTNSST